MTDKEFEWYEKHEKAIEMIINDEKLWKDWKENRDQWLWAEALKETKTPPKTREEKLWFYVEAYAGWVGVPWDPGPYTNMQIEL